MFDGLKRKIAATALGSLLKSLATNKGTQTTIVGLLAAAVLTIPGLDLGKLLSGDPVQIAHVISGVLVFFIGLVATRERANGKATALGTVAGALYAVQGSVEAVVTAVVIALLGYLTNQPTAPKTPKE